MGLLTVAGRGQREEASTGRSLMQDGTRNLCKGGTEMSNFGRSFRGTVAAIIAGFSFSLSEEATSNGRRCRKQTCEAGRVKFSVERFLTNDFPGFPSV